MAMTRAEKRVNEAAKAYVIALNSRMQFCGGFCTTFGLQIQCNGCKIEAIRLQELRAACA